MKFLLMSAIVAAVATASAATVMRSHTRPAAATASTMSLQDIHAAANVNKLPVENFEDRFETWSAAKR